MTTVLSASRERLLPTSDIPTPCPVETTKSKQVCEGRICYECSRSFRSCECKSCLKCGTLFMKYFGTNVMKGRSHCRVCRSPVCITCIVLIKGLEKVCTRCHLKQKEEEISTEKALSAIDTAKFGVSSTNASLSKLKTMEQKVLALFEAAKKGHDHIVVTLTNLGCDVNSTDSNKNTPLFYAAEGGHLQCVALLLEKGANVHVTNNVGWTPLHAVAWKGTTESHVECTELLLEMGVDLLATSNIGETAADVAERCNGEHQNLEILRSAEVEIAIEELQQKASAFIANGSNPKEKRFGQLILSLLKFVSSRNESKTTNKKRAFNLGLPMDSLPHTNSLDRSTLNKHICQKCGGPANNSPKASPLFKQKNNKPTADVEPIIRTPTPTKDENFKDTIRRTELEEKLNKLSKEKQDWEERCRKLMTSIAITNKDYQKQVEDLQEKLGQLQQERVADLTKCEATYANKLSKIKQETELSLTEMDERLQDSEKERQDLLHLQKNFKLTWIPDQLINECQQTKCRAPFSKTNRKHHCRCCGRVFCSKCSQHKVNLSVLDYTKPVRVCITCFALVDDMVSTDS